MLSGVSTTVRTSPLAPSGPTGFPFHWISMPPALPTFIRAASNPERVFVSPGWRMPEKISFPPLLIESHTRSVAASDNTNPELSLAA
jgi:hypothetical protein